MSDEEYQLIEKSWNQNPKERLVIEQIVEILNELLTNVISPQSKQQQLLDLENKHSSSSSKDISKHDSTDSNDN